jgi:hypothetical protein
MTKKTNKGGLIGGPMEAPLPEPKKDAWFKPQSETVKKFQKSGKTLAQKIGKLANVKK